MVSWGTRPPAWPAGLGAITLPWASLWRAESWGCSRSPRWGSQRMEQGHNLHWVLIHLSTSSVSGPAATSLLPPQTPSAVHAGKCCINVASIESPAIPDCHY